MSERQSPEPLGRVFDALGLSPSAEQAARLENFVELLEHWNATYNLTAVRDRREMQIQHIADCLAVVPGVARCGAAGRLLDVGSGGGLPGVVIATMLPTWQVTCVDAVGKKAAFVRQVAGRLSLPNLQSAHARVESLVAAPFDIVTARAFASLATLVSTTRRLMEPDGGVWMAMKGKTPEDELAELPNGIEAFHVEPIAVPGLAAERCVVWMRLRR